MADDRANVLARLRRALGTDPAQSALNRTLRLRFESLEPRQMFAGEGLTSEGYFPTAGLDPLPDDDVPQAEPQTITASGDPNDTAASLLAAGGPGDPSLPGFNNVGKGSTGNSAVTYLGDGWVITAAHVTLFNSTASNQGGVFFGGVKYAIDLSSIHQLRNFDASTTLADLKVFRIIGDPGLPSMLDSYINDVEPSGRVIMIGNGWTRGDAHYWHVNTATSPWTWTEQSPPAFPGAFDVAGFDTISPRAIRWGDNNVDSTGLVINVGPNTYTHGFTTVFDQIQYTSHIGQPDEGQASVGDSGGGVFALVNGKWVLAGIMDTVSNPINGQPASTVLYGSITVSADLSYYRDQILSIIDSARVDNRQVFYNQSKFDGNDAAANTSDDLAIAIDKFAYIPGSGAATWDNMTSYSRGINGVMFDLVGTHGTLTAADFQFRTGDTNTPSSWAAATAPAQILVRPGAGISGSDRVEIVWSAATAPKNTWLEVTVKGNDSLGGFNTNTGLYSSDVFYFGNKIGESTAGTATLAQTTITDVNATRTNTGIGATITNAYDFDRSGSVTITDVNIARTNTGNLNKINVAALPAAPAGDDDAPSEDAVATALAATKPADDGQRVPLFVQRALAAADQKRVSHEKAFAEWGHEHTLRSPLQDQAPRSKAGDKQLPERVDLPLDPL